MKYTILFLLLFISAGCAQTQLPGFIKWNYDYTYSHINPVDSLKYKMTPEDSLAVEFIVYYSSDSLSWFPLEQTPTKELEHYLLQYRYLYNNLNWYFYSVAKLGAVESDWSNVIREYFPQLNPDKTYNLRTIMLE